MDAAKQEQRIQTVCLLLLTAIALGTAAYFLKPVLIPFVLATFLVYCLSPIIDVQMLYLRLPRPVAVVTTILLGCVVLFLLWSLIYATVSQMTLNAPVYEQRFQDLLEGTADWLPLERFGIEMNELGSVLQISRESAGSLVRGLASAFMGVLSNGLLVVIFMIFIMAGSSTGTAPPGSLRDQMESGIKRYVVTKVLVSATTGILVGLVLWLLKVDFALVFGLLAFLLNFIPSIGSVVSTLLPLPIVVLSPDLSVTFKILAFAIPGAIQFTVGSVIEPKIMGESLDLHPVVVLLGLIFFGMIWGIVGMFLATPIVAVLKIVLERIELTAPVANVLAGRLDARPRAPG